MVAALVIFVNPEPTVHPTLLPFEAAPMRKSFALEVLMVQDGLEDTPPALFEHGKPAWESKGVPVFAPETPSPVQKWATESFQLQAMVFEDKAAAEIE